MLQKIRDKISGWIAGVIIVLVAGAFILWGIQYYFDQGSGNQDVVATVNSVPISTSHFHAVFSDLQKKLMAESPGHPLTEAMTQQLKSYALQSLITQTALITTLRHDGFHVGMPEVQLMITKAPQFQENGQFSQEKLMQVLYQANLTPAEFFQHVQSQWIISQVMNGISGSAFVLPHDVNHAFALQHQQRAFGYFIIPAALFSSTIKISDADSKNYYNTHQSEFQLPAQVSVAYIELSPKNIAKTVHVTETEAAQYYQSHLANYHASSFVSVKPAVIKLLQHQRINDILTKQSNTLAEVAYTNPDSLTLAAKTLNLPIQISPMISKSGEKTGIFANPKVLAAVFSDSVFQSNNNSSPIDLGNGTQIVLRIQKKNPATMMPFATVAAKIKATLTQKQAIAQAGVLAYHIQKALLAGKSVADIAKKNKLLWHAVPLMPFTQKSSIPQSILTTIFSIPPKNPHAILMNPQNYAVIMVTQLKNGNSANASAAKKQQLSMQLTAFWGQLLQHCLVNSVMVKSHIKLSRS